MAITIPLAKANCVVTVSDSIETPKRKNLICIHVLIYLTIDGKFVKGSFLMATQGDQDDVSQMNFGHFCLTGLCFELISHMGEAIRSMLYKTI